MNQWPSRIASVTGILIMAFAVMPVILMMGSGWELLILLMAVPGVLAGLLMLAGSRRIERAPGSATICFVLAAIFVIVSLDTGVHIFSGGGASLSLILHWTVILVPVALATRSFRSFLRARRTSERTSLPSD